MTNDLWQDCIDCKNKCCSGIAFPLFITSEEKIKHKDLNSKDPCFYLNDCNLCNIHDSRPYDCRFFPFDLMRIDSKIFWIIWQIDCSIANGGGSFEKYLEEHEQKLIPGFTKYIKYYTEFRIDELKNKYKYSILREARINSFESK